MVTEKDCLKPPQGQFNPSEAFVFLAQDKAKPAARQGRKITGLILDGRVALKKVARFFYKDIIGHF